MKSKVLALAILSCAAGLSNNAQADMVPQAAKDLGSGLYKVLFNSFGRENYYAGCALWTVGVVGTALAVYRKTNGGGKKEL